MRSFTRVQQDDDLAIAATAVTGTQALQSYATADADHVPSVVADRYEIIGLLGAGGMGRVYRARDRMLDETVALKLVRSDLVMDDEALGRFLQEVKLARRVTHVNVVRTFDVGRHSNDLFLTMELVDGHSLARLIAAGPLALAEVVRIALEIARGVAAAHATDVVHRDLKPDNVLVARSGRIAITDFGIACASEAVAGHRDRFLGTPAYMAPEQVETGEPIGPAADVYAFGVMLFEMLAGQRPFIAHDPVELAALRLHTAAPDARAHRAVPEPLAKFAQRCMARDIHQRPQNGSALIDELGKLESASHATLPHEVVAIVPYPTSRAVAILPLKASDELAHLADGLTEEIVDVLSMTRDLRVRPLAAARRALASSDDLAEVGRLLGVDVVVDGSLRQRGDAIRITARAIGVVDGFQLWASHFDTTPDQLLATSDAVGRAVASAVTVDLEATQRMKSDPRAITMCLAAKAKLRARWLDDTHDDIIAELEQALALAPEDATVRAVLAATLARSAYYGAADATLSRAIELAHGAVTLAPRSVDSWFALAVASLNSCAYGEAGHAVYQAVQLSPGSAMVQTQLGSMLLEGGALAEAIAHLEAANRLDPHGLAHIDLPRAYVYAGRWADAEREFTNAAADRLFVAHLFDAISRARFALWRGELQPVVYDVPAVGPSSLPEFVDIACTFHASGKLDARDRERCAKLVHRSRRRLRATFSQFMAEYLLFGGDHDEALGYVRIAVDAGLLDITWMSHCPLLAPLRTRSEFAALAKPVEARAHAVLSAIGLV